MVANLNMLEGMVIMATCDKVVPGMLMGAVRVDIPTVMFTGGYMAAGHRSDGRMITLTPPSRPYAAYVEAPSPREECKGRCAPRLPHPGACPLWVPPRRCAPWRKFWALPARQRQHPQPVRKMARAGAAGCPAGHVCLGA